MSLFDPRSALAVVGVILFLIALYLVLRNFAGANSLLSTLAGGTLSTIGVLQGRNVGTSHVSVSG